MTRRFHQRRHRRRSPRGRLFVAGRRLAAPPVPATVRRAVLAAEREALIHDLRTAKRARLPDLGIFKIKIKPAVKGGQTVTAFGKTFVTTAKPPRKLIKFRAAKALLEAV